MTLTVDASLQDILLILPLIVLFAVSLLPISIKVLRGNKEQNSFATMTYGLMGVVGAALASLAFANKFFAGNPVMAFSDALVFDGTSVISTMLVLLATAFTLMTARENLATCTEQFSEFVFLLLNSAIGMLIVAWSNDLIVTFIGIEMMSLCLYILIAMSLEGRLSKEAAFKYFVLGSFASAVFLYGIAFVYGSVGSVYITEVRTVAIDLIATNRLFLIGVILTVIGFCFKVSIAPFHAWTPDVYEGAPTPITGFMATGVKIVSFVAFLRFISISPLVANHSEGLMVALQWLAVATILIGNIAAILQNSFKRMLAYSSVAHSGYVMIALIAAGIGGDQVLGGSGVIYYMLTYSVMTLGAFAAASLFESRHDKPLAIEDLRGFASRRPGMALCITIFMLSLAGIPPTIGFFGKFYVFAAAYRQGLLWLAIWGVIGSVISVYYYLRPVVMMYMQELGDVQLQPRNQLTRLVMVVSAFLIIAGGIAVDPVYQLVFKSVRQLFPG